MLGLSCLDTSPQLNCRRRSAEGLKCMCLYPLYPDGCEVFALHNAGKGC